MGRVLPISILNEQEAKTDFRTGTRFSILEVVAAKIQLGKLWSQMIKWNPRTWCTNNFFSDRVQTQVTQRKSNLEIIQVRSARDDILFFAQPEIRVAVNEPIHGEPADGGTSPSTSGCAWWVFPKNWGWCPRWIMNDSVCRGMALTDCSSTLFQPSLAPAAVEFPSSLHFWISKEEKLDKRSWRGAWELPSWKLGSWKLVWSSLVFKKI